MAAERRRRTRWALAAAWLLAAGCVDGAAAPRLVCHNSNCAAAPDPTRDDTLVALREGLGLLEAPAPRLDGLEIDLLWDAAAARCLFAHDVPADGEPAAATADEAAAEIEAALVAPAFATRAGAALLVYVELKGYVGADHADVHTPADRVAHADCALALRDRLEVTAGATGHALEVVFTSFDPALLQAMVDAGAHEREGVRLAAIQGVPPPLDGQTRPLGDFAGVGIELVEAHPGWLQPSARDMVRSAGVGLSYWMFSAGSDTFARIERDAPEHVVTNEAELLDRWLRGR